MSNLAYILQDIATLWYQNDVSISTKIERIALIFHYQAKYFLSNNVIFKEAQYEFDLKYKNIPDLSSSIDIFRDKMDLFTNLCYSEILSVQAGSGGIANLEDIKNLYKKIYYIITFLNSLNFKIKNLRGTNFLDIEYEYADYRKVFICMTCGKIYKKTIKECDVCGSGKNLIQKFTNLV